VKFEEEIKQSKFDSSTQKAVLNVMFTSNWINAHFRDVFKPYDLTPQQYNVLRILRGKHPKSANPGEIKEVMLDKNPDLTRLCDRLCKLDLITRGVDKTNRRKINIKISDAGLELLKTLDPKIKKMQSSMKSLTEDEANQLSDLLDKMRQG
jgi:DNA-binding MarR family transcriptional regulator